MGLSLNQKILQMASIGPLADEVLTAEFGAVRFWELDDRAGWLREHGSGVVVLATSVRAGCDAELIAKLPRLGAICSWGVGFDTIDVGAATLRNIQVSVTPDVLDDCVADMAWALLLAAARRVGAADRYVRDGKWQRLGEFPISTRVSGKRLGILGLGRIGAAIARRGEGFSMSAAYHSRSPRDSTSYRFEPSLRALAEWADFLVVACPGGAETRHLVSSDVLNALGPRGILVNIARGSVVDTPALIDALESGRLGGAGLDVVEGEPGAPIQLRCRDDVILTPHIGSATFETRQAMEQLVVDNVRSFLHSGRVFTPA